MLGFIKSKLGIVTVTSTPTYINVAGINTYTLFKDIYQIWGSSVIQKHMFSVVRRDEVRLRHFFGLDFLYILRTLYDTPRTYTLKRSIKKVIDELLLQTWLGNIERPAKSLTDMSVINNVVPFPLKDYQSEYIKQVGIAVPAYRLRGYMLDAAAGSGKTVTGLVLAEALHVDHVIIVSPANAVHRVWEDTIANTMMHKKTYWLSTGNSLPNLNHHYYICHYEALRTILDFVKANVGKIGNIAVVLDESHNFNRIDAQRTQMFIELCNIRNVVFNNWSSGTPIQALGTECIPFLKCIDPLFDAESEERFRKIYGRDAKRANDILRNRIGHLKYHVKREQAIDIKPIVETVKVSIPNGMEYTLDFISKKMRDFIDERKSYYTKNFSMYKNYYDDALKYFEEHGIKSQHDKDEYKKYKEYFATIVKGYDPITMKAETAFCNRYEMTVISPVLPKFMVEKFRSSRSVIKYVDLKIMGEALGGILGRARTKCHIDMVDHINFAEIIDNSKKKTVIFTSFAEVVEKINDKLVKEGYKPALIYGATNKNLSPIIKEFFDDPDVNPLIATYQSLSTAVPLIAANTTILVNQPFRDSIRTQTLARTSRLGQDEQTYVFDTLLDTGALPNISTRSNDIMKWSAEQVASILHVGNIDLDTLSLEAELVEEQSTESSSLIQLPTFLYHGSAYSQRELMPGFKRSGELVKWDDVESNEWLYTTDSKDEAVLLGLGSSIEKKFNIDRFSTDVAKRTIVIETPDKTLTKESIKHLPLYLYTIKADNVDGWQANFNPVNGMKGEYKTQDTIDSNIVRKETIDVGKILSDYELTIKHK